jgi:hypothetical protein
MCLEGLKETRQAQIVWPTSDPRFESGTSCILSRNGKHPTAKIGLVDTSFFRKFVNYSFIFSEIFVKIIIWLVNLLLNLLTNIY